MKFFHGPAIEKEKTQAHSKILAYCKKSIVQRIETYPALNFMRVCELLGRFGVT